MILRGHVFSQALQLETGLCVLAPANPDGRVVYLLHGLCGRGDDWLDYTLLPVFARDHGALFVMPEVQRSFYADQKHGLKYFSYVADELPEIVARTFNVSADRDRTAVIGASMGGYGALRCALSRPDRFGWCGALSSACLYLDEGFPTLRADRERAAALYGEQVVTDLSAVFGEDFVWNDRYGVRALARTASALPHRPRIYAACGRDDSMMIADNRRFAADMAAIGYPVTFEEGPGGHDWTFFNQALEKALAFCFG